MEYSNYKIFILGYFLSKSLQLTGQIVAVNGAIITHVDTLCGRILAHSVSIMKGQTIADSISGVYLYNEGRFQTEFLKTHKRLKHIEIYGKNLRLSELKPLKDTLQYLEVKGTKIIEDSVFDFPNLRCFATRATKHVLSRLPLFLSRCPQLLRLRIDLQNADNLDILPHSIQSFALNICLPIDTLHELLFKQPQLKYLELSCFHNKTPPILKILQPNLLIEALTMTELDLANPYNIASLKQLVNLKALFLYQHQVQNADFAALSFIEKIYLWNVDDKELLALQRKYPNIKRGNER